MGNKKSKIETIHQNLPILGTQPTPKETTHGPKKIDKPGKIYECISSINQKNYQTHKHILKMALHPSLRPEKDFQICLTLFFVMSDFHSEFENKPFSTTREALHEYSKPERVFRYLNGPLLKKYGFGDQTVQMVNKILENSKPQRFTVHMRTKLNTAELYKVNHFQFKTKDFNLQDPATHEELQNLKDSIYVPYDSSQRLTKSFLFKQINNKSVCKLTDYSCVDKKELGNLKVGAF